MSASLFDQANATSSHRTPLAERMRPKNLRDYVGQSHILGPGRLLRRAIEADRVSSLILYGPPGTGKTTLARVIAEHSQATFVALNAVLSGVKTIREEIGAAQNRLSRFDQSTILFVDELHRFNQAQQDALLPWVERGVVTLIGATTENPYFEVNNALNSRSHIFQLRPLSPAELAEVVQRTLRDARGYADRKVKVDEAALKHWIDVVNGDARALLNALELAVETTPPIEGQVLIDLGVAEASIQERAVLYDRDGDAHFDTMSALIKSLRGSDPDASLYWLAKMIYAGEPARQIFRRLLIFASEDVGLAWPQGIGIVEACAAAFDRVGMPEGRFQLSHAVLAMATAPKSNSTMGLFDALASIRIEEHGSVPTHLKDSNRDGDSFGHGQGYLYPHAYQNHWVAQDYLPESLKGKVFYVPSTQGDEAQVGVRVRALREAQLEGVISGGSGDPILSKVEAFQSVSPHQSQLEEWVERAMGNVSGELATVREALFNLARLERTNRVLDLNAGGGLFTWPAARAAMDGGVWSVCFKTHEAEAMSAMARDLPWVHQPQIIMGNLGESLVQVSQSEQLQRVSLDHVIGRSMLSDSSLWKTRLNEFYHMFREGRPGKVTLAEPYLYGAQRLSALMTKEAGEIGLNRDEDWSALEDQLYQTLASHWHKSRLENFLREHLEEGDSSGQITIEELYCSRRVRLSSERITRWLSDRDESYLSQLSAFGINDHLRERIVTSLSELAGEVITWQVAWLIVHFEVQSQHT